MNQRTIFITEKDMERLRKLMPDTRRSPGIPAHLKDLAGELDRAETIASRKVPSDVITMNSRVQLVDLESGEAMEYTLVFPQDADLAQGKISVLAPIGTAMLGYRVGDVFSWQVPSGERRIKVEAILYQPEAAGDYDL